MASKKEKGRALAEAIRQKDKRINDTDELIKFSFKYLSFANGKFSCAGAEASYFFELLDRLKSLSFMKMSEFLANRSASLRSHPIRWADVTEDSFGIPNEEQVADTPYQFALSANESGRVHGFIIDTRFYVVWLDKNHRLYR